MQQQKKTAPALHVAPHYSTVALEGNECAGLLVADWSVT